MNDSSDLVVDQFVVRVGLRDDLASALVKLLVVELSPVHEGDAVNTYTDKLFTACHHKRPTPLERIAAIGEIASPSQGSGPKLDGSAEKGDVVESPL